MSLPTEISTATVLWGPFSTLLGVDVGEVTVTIEPILGGTAKALTWSDTAHQLVPFSASTKGEDVISLAVPHTDQAGFIDGSGQDFTDWSYRATADVRAGSARVQLVKIFQVPTGTNELNLGLVADGTAGEPQVSPMAVVLSVNGRSGNVVIVDEDGETIPGLTVDEVGDWLADYLDALGPGEPGADGKSAYEIAVDDGFEGTVSAWLASLVGDDGKAVELQVTATHIQWRHEGGTWSNLIALSDLAGDDGLTPEIGTSATHIRWRHEGGDWSNLIALADLKGDDGAALEIQVTATHIQTRLAGGSWSNLIALDELKGGPGDDAQVENVAVEVSGVYPARPHDRTDVSVMWIGENPPPAGGTGAIDGLDTWLFVESS